MKKPTAKMIDVLKSLSQDGVIAHYMPYMGRLNPNPYYFMSTGNLPRCTSQINGLRASKLVEVFDKEQYNACHKVRISAAGRKFLKDLNHAAD